MRAPGAAREPAAWLALGLLGVAMAASAADGGAAAAVTASATSARAPAAAVTHDAAHAAAAANEPQKWLMRMNHALMTRSYDGVFSHWQDGQVETLHIIHRVQGEAVTERLESLDGSGRQFVRAGNTLTCYLPDQRTVLVERSSAPSLVLGTMPRLDPVMSRYYQLQSLGRTRLLGQRTQLIAVTPKDAYRYGYRLWIQESTGMPLKTQLCNTHGEVIEQVVFSSLSMRAHIPDSAFRPQIATAGFQWLRNDGAPAASTDAASSWSAAPLPPGFHLTAQAVQLLPGSSEPVAHLVFTDGLASVSVFVQSHVVAHASGQVVGGAGQVGSSSTLTSVEEGRKYVAVGEVPPETVRFIVDSLMRQGAASPLPVPGLPAAVAVAVAAPVTAPTAAAAPASAPAFAPALGPAAMPAVGPAAVPPAVPAAGPMAAPAARALLSHH